MAKILVIADIYFESQYFVDTIPQAKEFRFSDRVSNITGSKMLNAARVIAKLNNSVGIYGKVGDDSFGVKSIQQIKNEYDLGTNFIKKIDQKGISTGQIVVTTNNSGDSSVVLYGGANNLFTENDIEKIIEISSKVDLIYCCTNLHLDLLYKLIRELKNLPTQIFIDLPNRLKELNPGQLSGSDYLAPNREEAESILSFKISDIDEAKNAALKLRQKASSNILITLDKDGCVFLEKNSPDPIHYPAKLVDQVDATGAGDIFRAVFVSTILKTNNIDKSIKLALDYATRSVELKGVDNTIKKLF